METDERTEKQSTRRSLLKGIVGLVGMTVVPKIKPIFPEATKSSWQGVEIRGGDTPTSLCKFYGICDPRKIKKLSEIQNPQNPNLIHQGEIFYLPITTEGKNYPFKKMAWEIEGVTSFLNIINNEEEFLQESGDLYYDGENFPGLFVGHSFEEHSEPHSFHWFLRQLITKDFDCSKVTVWIGRNFVNQNGDWLKCQVEPKQLGYTKLPEEIPKLLNSQKIALMTCAVEAGKENPQDRIYAVLKIVDYASDGPL